MAPRASVNKRLRWYLDPERPARGDPAGNLAHVLYSTRVGGLNPGTGQGYSVLEMVAALERASACPAPYEIVDHRPGDIATCYADATLAREGLGWQARLGLDVMVSDT